MKSMAASHVLCHGLTPRLIAGLMTSLLLPMPVALAADNEHSPVAAVSGQPISALKRLDSLRSSPATPGQRARTLRHVPQPAMTTPAVQSWQTTQGTPVLFVASPILPMVDVRLTFDAGSARDSEIMPGAYGLAHLAANLLDEGTRSQTADQIAATFEQVGTQFSASAYRDMFVVEIRSLSAVQPLQTSISQLLALLQDAQFPADSLARVKQNQLVGQKQRFDSPAAIAGIRFFREVYADHPYAQPSSGTASGIARVDSALLQQFKQRYLVNQNLNIAITGALDANQARQIAQQLADALPAGQHAAALPQPAMQTARIVRVPYDSEQTHIMIGQPAVSRLNPAVPALMVGNEILGGGDFNADLMRALREQRGLTYGVYSGFGLTRSQGPFSISYSTRADQAETSLQVTRDTLTQFLRQTPDRQRVEEVKMGLLNGYPLSLASNAAINGTLSMMGFYGLPVTYMADYPQQIASVTPPQIQAAFAAHVRPEQLVTVIVGRTDAGRTGNGSQASSTSGAGPAGSLAAPTAGQP